MVTECVAEYRWFSYQLRYMQIHDAVGDAQFDDGSQCPLCPPNLDNSLSVIHEDRPVQQEESPPETVVTVVLPQEPVPHLISMDADFQLVRKKSAGEDCRADRFSSFFLNQQEVDTFLSTYLPKSSSSNNSSCSNFQAGNALRSKVKNDKLDIKALFGSVCRHAYPQFFFNLRHGERLGYAVFLIEEFLRKNPQAGTKVVMYDIACQLQAHLKRIGHSAQNLTFAVPIFHCFGHKTSCQLQYNPRSVQGVGLCDGEAIERLWSYLGRFSKITKEMTMENRQGILTDALLHQSEKIKDNLSVSLIKRLKKTEVTAVEAENDLQLLLQHLPERLSFDDIEEMIAAQQDSQNEVIPKCSFTVEEEYALALLKQDTFLQKMSTSDDLLTEKWQKELTKLQKEVDKTKIDTSAGALRVALATAFEKKKENYLLKARKSSCERIFLLSLKKKYSEGQSIAKRLARQIQKVNSSLGQFLQELNQLVNIDPKYTFDDIKTPSAAAYTGRNLPQSGSIPPSLQKDIIDAHLRLKRAREEEGFCKKEMLYCLFFYQSRLDKLLQVEKRNYMLTSWITKEGVNTEIILSELHKSFEGYIHLPPLKTPFSDRANLTVMNGLNVEPLSLELLEECSSDESNYSSSDDD